MLSQKYYCTNACTRVVDDQLILNWETEVKNELVYQHSHVRNTPELVAAAQQKRSPYKATWWQQFKAVFWRSFLSVIKEPMIMQVRIMQTIVSPIYTFHYIVKQLNF